MPPVKIYSTPSCIYCRHAKEFFTAHGVSYEDINVAADQAKAQEMVNLTGQMGVPVIVVGTDVIVGFDEPRLRELLKIA